MFAMKGRLSVSRGRPMRSKHPASWISIDSYATTFEQLSLTTTYAAG
jgi:hypothetical protein